MNKIFIPLIFFSSLLVAGHVCGQTIVGGLISSDTTWTLAGSPYYVQNNNIIITNGVTLTIERGVTVKFFPVSGLPSTIQVDGTIRAMGTSSQPITFTSSDTVPAPGDWGYILFNSVSAPYNFSNGTGSILQYCIVEYGGGANVVDNGAIRINNARPYIVNCTLRYNSKQAIRIWDLTGNIYINNCSIQNNTVDTGAVNVRGATSSRTTITGSTISNNNSTLSGIFKTAGIYSAYSNISVKNSVLTGNNGTAMMGYNKDVNRDTISWCNISDNQGEGIYYYYYDTTASSNSSRHIITDNTISNNVNDGIYFFYNSYYVYGNLSIISRNTISNNGENGIYYASFSVPSAFYTANNSFTINDNNINNNGNNGIFYQFPNPTETFSYSFTITNNTVSNNGDNGIFFAYGDLSQFNNHSINGNTITRNGINGIYIYYSSTSSVNTYTINNNLVNYNLSNGIKCYYVASRSNSHTIDKNILSNNLGSGIYYSLNYTGAWSASPNTPIITNNKIVYNNSLNGGGLRVISKQPNISLNGTIANNVIASNNATGQGGGAFIDVKRGTVSFTQNSIVNNYACNSSAIYLKSPGNLTVNYNTIVNNKTTGITPNRAVYIETTNKNTNPTFNYNNIYNLSCDTPFYELWNQSANDDTLTAQNCYWQKSIQAGIDSVIYDTLDNSNLGRVVNSPFATVPDTTAPVTPVKNLTKTQVGSDVQLNWTANTETDIAGYKVYWGSPMGYSFANSVDVGNVTSYLLNNANASDTIEVTAYDVNADSIDDQVDGFESWFTGDSATMFVPIALISDAPGNTICSGQSITFTATGASTYEFFVNDTSVQGPGSNNVFISSVLSTGDTVKVTGANTCGSCGSATSAPIIVTVNPGPAPTVTASSSVPAICPGDTALLTVTGATNYLWSPASGLNTTSGDSVEASPISTTAYTVTGTNGGCTDSATVTVNVNPAPSTPVISVGGPTIFCDGDSVTLTSSASAYYDWSNGSQSQSVTVITSGNYAVTITDIHGCTAYSPSQPVIVNPIPTADAGSDDTICSGNSTQLNAIGGASFSWNPATGLNDPNIANPTANPTASTTYFVTVTDTNGCSAEDSVKIEVYPVPSLSISPDTLSFCPGDSGTLTATSQSGSLVYSWFNESFDSVGTGNTLMVDTVGKYYAANIDTVTGCPNMDSAIVISYPAYYIPDAKVICSNDSIFLQGAFQTMAGTYYDTLYSVNVCDSVIATTLTVNPTYNTPATAALCSGDSILLQGAFQTTAGTYYDTLYSVNSCDSVIATTLTVNPTYSMTDPAIAICNGDSTIIYGTYRTTAGTYYDSLTTVDGCDSTHSTILSINPTYSISDPAVDICTGDSALIYGTYQNTGGSYYDSLTTVDGCDSIHSTVLTVVNSTYSTNTPDKSICSGDSVMIFGIYHSISGTYYDSLTTVNGCDSVIITALTVYVCTGVENFDFINSFKIYPNPTSGKITLQTNLFQSDARIIVYNVLGELVYDQPFIDRQIDLSYLSGGIYFLHIYLTETTLRKKIIKL